MDYKHKYIKYKTKYIKLSGLFDLLGGTKNKTNKTNKKLKKNFVDSNIKPEKIVNSNNFKMSKNSMLGGIEPNYTENLSEPWFTLISLGLKTVEGRKNKGRFREMKQGDIIQWVNQDFAPRSVLTEVTGKAEYSTFEEYLETEGLEKCLPGINNLETGLSVYYKYFSKEEEIEFGVVAIRLKLIE